MKKFKKKSPLKSYKTREEAIIDSTNHKSSLNFEKRKEVFLESNNNVPYPINKDEKGWGKYQKRYDELRKVIDQYYDYINNKMELVLENGDYEDEEYVYKFMMLPTIHRQESGEPREGHISTHYKILKNNPLRKTYYNILFLDIDGVLVTDDSLKLPEHEYYGHPFDKDCVKVLNEILQAVPNTKIVLSSDWRIEHNNDLRFLSKIFHHNKVDASPIACTQVISKKERLNEIWQYINKKEKPYKIKGWAVIDDEDYGFGSDLVKCDFKYGLKEKGLKERAIFILKKDCSDRMNEMLIRLKVKTTNDSTPYIRAKRINDEIESADAVFRININSDEQEKKLAWKDMNRKEFQVEELDILQQLRDNKISTQTAIDSILELMEKYYGSKYDIKSYVK